MYSSTAGQAIVIFRHPEWRQIYLCRRHRSVETVGSGCIFYDVTQGDMDVNCTGTHKCYRPSGTNGVLSTSDTSYLKAYGTTTGWDFATGIGTVNATNFVNNWP
jgi:hypothetical protein